MANQFRNYCMTVNNPTENDGEFYDYMKNLDHVKYFCFARERGDGTDEHPEGTEHFQIYIEFDIGKKFEVMKKLFPRAHIENRSGTKAQARDYVRKVGKYEDKKHTQISEVYEYGIFAEERERTDITDIIAMIDNGETIDDIETAYPSQAFRYAKHIEERRQRYLQRKFGDTFRDMTVTYLYGNAGSGKTRYVTDKYGYKNIYRITDYGNPFDTYAGQDVIIFEEFRSDIKIGQMLTYLEGHPLQLPARYSNKVACYTKVYIISNIALESQYKHIQEEQPKTWKALLRRINYVWDIDRYPEPLPRENSLQLLMPLSAAEADELGF